MSDLKIDENGNFCQFRVIPQPATDEEKRQGIMTFQVDLTLPADFVEIRFETPEPTNDYEMMRVYQDHE